MQTDLPYILALSFQKGIGDITARKIVQFFGSAEKAWNSSSRDLMQISGIRQQISKDFGNKKWLDLAFNEIEYCKNIGYKNEEELQQHIDSLSLVNKFCIVPYPDDISTAPASPAPLPATGCPGCFAAPLPSPCVR